MATRRCLSDIETRLPVGFVSTLALQEKGRCLLSASDIDYCSGLFTTQPMVAMRTLALALLLVTWAAVSAQDDECAESELGYVCKKQMTEYFALHWSLGPTTSGGEAQEGEIAMAMVGQTTGWVGVGFPEEAGTMAPADVVLGWVSSEETVADVYRPRRNFISIDELVEDVQLKDVRGTEADGETTIRFVWRLDDIRTSISLNKRIPVNVAIGTSDRLRYHGFGTDRRASRFVRLGRGEEKDMSQESTPSEKRKSVDRQETETQSSTVPLTSVTESLPAPEPVTTPDAESDMIPSPQPAFATLPESIEEWIDLEEESETRRPRLRCPESDSGYDCMKILSELLTMHWTPGPAKATEDHPEISDGEVAMALVGQINGWVGISFTESRSDMAPADAVIGWVDGSDVSVLPYRIITRTVASANEDPRIGIRDVAGSEEDNVTTISFVWTGDFTFNVDLTKKVDMNWAVGSTDSLRYHGPFNRGSFVVNLLLQD